MATGTCQSRLQQVTYNTGRGHTCGGGHGGPWTWISPPSAAGSHPHTLSPSGQTSQSITHPLCDLGGLCRTGGPPSLCSRPICARHPLRHAHPAGRAAGRRKPSRYITEDSSKQQRATKEGPATYLKLHECCAHTHHSSKSSRGGACWTLIKLTQQGMHYPLLLHTAEQS